MEPSSKIHAKRCQLPLLENPVKKGSIKMTTSACLTHSSRLSVGQVKWGLDLGKRGARSSRPRKFLGLIPDLSWRAEQLQCLWEEDKLLLGWWSNGLLSTWYICAITKKTCKLLFYFSFTVHATLHLQFYKSILKLTLFCHTQAHSRILMATLL